MTSRFLLVVDLECTCSDESSPTAEQVAPEAMEIIEIGAVIATMQGEVLDRFARLARPTERPALTAFCASLTGIRQADVHAAEPLGSALEALESWVSPSSPELSGWASWGNFDRRQIERECARKGLSNPLASLSHTNLKERFATRRRIKQVGMAKALELVGLPLLGTHHRGLDDALNIAQLIRHALND